MDRNIVDPPADIPTLRRLYRRGLLDRESFRTGSSIVRPAAHWVGWGSRMLLVFGMVLIAAGVVFFFAYNHFEVPKFAKLGGVLAGIAAALALSLVFRKKELIANLFRLAAALLCGVFLAVFGQVYQTGADSFEMFLGWALLILPWAVLSGFASLWAMWLTVLHIAYFLIFGQLEIDESMHFTLYLFILALFDSGLLLIKELFSEKKNPWLRARWIRALLASSVITLLTIGAINTGLSLVLEGWDYRPHGWTFFTVRILPLMFWLGLIVPAAIYYFRKNTDLFPIALAMFSVSSVLMVLFAGFLLGGYVELDWPVAVLLIAAFVVINIVLVVSGSRKIHGLMKKRGAEQ